MSILTVIAVALISLGFIVFALSTPLMLVASFNGTWYNLGDKGMMSSICIMSIGAAVLVMAFFVEVFTCFYTNGFTCNL